MKITYIELLGQKHPLCFSLAASEKLSEKLGGFDAMSEALNSGDLGKAAHVAAVTLDILLKAGRTYCAAIGEELPPELPCSAADLIDVRSPEAVEAIFSAIANDTEREVEVASKNA